MLPNTSHSAHNDLHTCVLAVVLSGCLFGGGDNDVNDPCQRKELALTELRAWCMRNGRPPNCHEFPKKDPCGDGSTASDRALADLCQRLDAADRQCMPAASAGP